MTTLSAKTTRQGRLELSELLVGVIPVSSALDTVEAE